MSQDQPDTSLGQYLEHSQAVWGAAFSKTSANEFASVSQDQLLKLWDNRQTKSTSTARVLSTPRSVSFSAGNSVAVGCEDGHVVIYDARSMDAPVATILQHKRRVTAVSFAPSSDLLATTSNDRGVSVIDANGKAAVYSNNEHTDVVRGVTWNQTVPSRFYAVSWDGYVSEHIVPSERVA